MTSKESPSLILFAALTYHVFGISLAKTPLILSPKYPCFRNTLTPFLRWEQTISSSIFFMEQGASKHTSFTYVYEVFLQSLDLPHKRLGTGLSCACLLSRLSPSINTHLDFPVSQIIHCHFLQLLFRLSDTLYVQVHLVLSLHITMQGDHPINRVLLVVLSSYYSIFQFFVLF